MKSPPSLSRAREGKEFVSPRKAHIHPLRKAKSIWRLEKSAVDLSSLMPCLLEGNLEDIAADGP
jgi:hypothetical protein